MVALIERVTREGGATREKLRQKAPKSKAGRPKHYVFKYRPQTKAFDLKLSFRKSNVERSEIIRALEAILDELRHS